MKAIEVFSKALKYLADKLVSFISETTDQKRVNPSSIQWVLTVPAIWKPGARHFMRKAAYKVIFITCMDPNADSARARCGWGLCPCATAIGCCILFLL